MYPYRGTNTGGGGTPFYRDFAVPAPADIPLAGETGRKPRISKRGILIAAIGALVASVAFLVWMAFNVGGERLSTAVDDFGEAVAAFLGAAGCWYSATQNRHHDRKAWALLGAACFSWGAGEVVWSVYEVIGNVKVPFPSVADIGFIGETVLAAIAMLSFGTVRLAGLSRGKMFLDGAVAAASLLFISWIVVLGALYHAGADSVFAMVLGLAYPVGDVLIITLAVMLMVHAPSGAKLAYGLIGCGALAIAVSDSIFAYMTTAGTYGNATDMISTGWVAGFLMIGLAGLQPELKRRSAKPNLPGYFEILLPYGAILVVAAVSFMAVGLNGDTITFWLGRVTIVLAFVRLLLGSLQNLRHIHVLHAQTVLLEEHFSTHPDPAIFDREVFYLDWSAGTEYAPRVDVNSGVS
jgi:hypothetical protein